MDTPAAETLPRELQQSIARELVMVEPRSCNDALEIAGYSPVWSAALDRPELCSSLFRVALKIVLPISDMVPALKELDSYLASTCPGANRLYLRFKNYEVVEDVVQLLDKICDWCEYAKEVDAQVGILDSFDLWGSIYPYLSINESLRTLTLYSPTPYVTDQPLVILERIVDVAFVGALPNFVSTPNARSVTLKKMKSVQAGSLRDFCSSLRNLEVFALIAVQLSQEDRSTFKQLIQPGVQWAGPVDFFVRTSRGCKPNDWEDFFSEDGDGGGWSCQNHSCNVHWYDCDPDSAFWDDAGEEEEEEEEAEERALVLAEYVLFHWGACIRSISIEAKTCKGLQPFVEGSLERCRSLERLELWHQSAEPYSCMKPLEQLARQILSRLGEYAFPAGLRVSFGHMSLSKEVLLDALLLIRGLSSKGHAARVEFLACSFGFSPDVFLALGSNPQTDEVEVAQIWYTAARPSGTAEKRRLQIQAGRWPVKEYGAPALTFPAVSVAGVATELQEVRDCRCILRLIRDSRCSRKAAVIAATAKERVDAEPPEMFIRSEHYLSDGRPRVQLGPIREMLMVDEDDLVWL